MPSQRPDNQRPTQGEWPYCRPVTAHSGIQCGTGPPCVDPSQPGGAADLCAAALRPTARAAVGDQSSGGRNNALIASSPARGPLTWSPPLVRRRCDWFSWLRVRMRCSSCPHAASSTNAVAANDGLCCGASGRREGRSGWFGHRRVQHCALTSGGPRVKVIGQTLWWACQQNTALKKFG